MVDSKPASKELEAVSKASPAHKMQALTRETELDKELLAASHLRAISFYAYPPERALAGKVCFISI